MSAMKHALQRCLAAALIAALPALAALPSRADTLTTDYTVTIRGFPVGQASLQAQIDGDRYRIKFTGTVTGIARLFSNIETSAASDGAIAEGSLHPDEYRHLWRENDETETVDLQFADRRLTAVSVDPPVKHPERYVPLADSDKRDVLDPVSAFVWPAADGVTPAICDRTLPIMDGHRRFDIALSFKRTASFETRDNALSRPAIVCGFRYKTLAGNRIGKKDSGTIQNGDDMEVWIAPAGHGLAAPARIQVRTRFGRVVLLATKMGIK
jgi:hypothetical protein